jgi:hypothetical protein
MHNKFLDKFKFLERNHQTCFKSISNLLDSGAVDTVTVENERLKTQKKVKKLMQKNSKISEVEARNLVSDPIMQRFHP